MIKSYPIKIKKMVYLNIKVTKEKYIIFEHHYRFITSIKR